MLFPYNPQVMKKSAFHLAIIIACIFSLVACNTQTTTNSGNNPSYEDGYYLENKGSDTMVNLALYWAEQYAVEKPNVSISVSGGGSGTGIAALISNTVDIANASRQIKAEEISEANKNGVEPVEFVVARDAIAVIVNPQNPIDHLTIQQISDIFSGKLENWSDLGGENRPIVKLSRETNSGTHVYFLEAVIRKGLTDDKTIFSADTLLLPSSEGIISEVKENPNAIGYDGLGYITADVKVLGIAKEAGQPYIMPNVETVNQNLYPIARDLYMYTNGTPTDYILDYINWILSDEGQQTVLDLGFVPILKADS